MASGQQNPAWRQTHEGVAGLPPYNHKRLYTYVYILICVYIHAYMLTDICLQCVYSSICLCMFVSVCTLYVSSHVSEYIHFCLCVS